MRHSIRSFVVYGVLLVAVLAAFLAFSGGGAKHRVVVVVPEAAGLIKGFQIRAAGRPVGKVGSVTVTRDYQARVEMVVDDDVWPLPTDSRVTVRMGGTIKTAERYLDLRRGTGGANIPDGGRLAASRFLVPTEFDDVFRTFDKSRRKDLNATIDKAGPSAAASGDPLARTVRRAPPTLSELRGTLAELGRNDEALHALVRQTDTLSAAVQQADPGLAQLIASAGSTFSAVASEGGGLQRALAEAPQTLGQARDTLERADRTLDVVDATSRAISGGITAARTVTKPIDRTLRAVQATGPDLRQALATTRTASPALQGLLSRATTIMPVVESTSKEATTQLKCIRPYAPEIAGFASTWGAGAWGSRGDRQDRYWRVSLGPSPYPAVTPGLSGADLHRLLPGVSKTLVKPPGFIVGQPWLQPDCGQDEDTLDPLKDPEAMALDPLSKLLTTVTGTNTKEKR